MPAEQALGQEVDERMDIYSLGAVLYNLLSLNTSIEGRTVSQVLMQVAAGSVTPIEKWNEGLMPHCPGGKVPDSLAAVTMKALSWALSH